MIQLLMTTRVNKCLTGDAAWDSLCPMAPAPALLAFALLASGGRAALSSPQDPAASQDMVLRCGSVLGGGGESRGRATVVVAEGRVAAVLDGHPPATARMVDLSNHTCLPGLID